MAIKCFKIVVGHVQRLYLEFQVILMSVSERDMTLWDSQIHWRFAQCEADLRKCKVSSWILCAQHPNLSVTSHGNHWNGSVATLATEMTRHCFQCKLEATCLYIANWRIMVALLPGLLYLFILWIGLQVHGYTQKWVSREWCQVDIMYQNYVQNTKQRATSETWEKGWKVAQCSARLVLTLNTLPDFLQVLWPCWHSATFDTSFSLW